MLPVQSNGDDNEDYTGDDNDVYGDDDGDIDDGGLSVLKRV